MVEPTIFNPNTNAYVPFSECPDDMLSFCINGGLVYGDSISKAIASVMLRERSIS